MRSIWQDLIQAAVVGMVIPALMLNGAVLYLEREELASSESPPAETLATEYVSLPVRILQGDGTVAEQEVDEYLVGVLLAEMPADFEMEALKAQAVAARTYTCKARITGGKHGNGSVCGKSTCCQAYLKQEEYINRGGTAGGVQRVRDAVLATSGYVLMYGDELIEATYFSCSGGATEDAAAVWGTEYPYLQSVRSPGEEDAAVFSDTAVFSPEEFQKALGVTLSGNPETWFGLTAYTEGGGVAVMTIGEEQYAGTALRTALGLRSTAFSVDISGEQIIITTRGYGHRVGMSQYGAEAMAVKGSSFREILSHYYPGTELVRLKLDENGEMVSEK